MVLVYLLGVFGLPILLGFLTSYQDQQSISRQVSERARQSNPCAASTCQGAAARPATEGTAPATHTTGRSTTTFRTEIVIPPRSESRETGAGTKRQREAMAKRSPAKSARPAPARQDDGPDFEGLQNGDTTEVVCRTDDDCEQVTHTTALVNGERVPMTVSRPIKVRRR